MVSYDQNSPLAKRRLSPHPRAKEFHLPSDSMGADALLLLFKFLETAHRFAHYKSYQHHHRKRSQTVLSLDVFLRPND
jgi:hypothetical protein